MEAKSLGDFVSIYEKFAASENKSNRTIEAYTAAVSHFDRFLGGCDDIHRVQAEDLRRYIRSLQERFKWYTHPTIKGKADSLSPHSIACYVRSIRSFWSWLKREGFIDHNPFEQVKPPKAPQKMVGIFTPEQVTGLLKSIPKRNPRGYRDFTIIITLYGTGLRIGELLNLRVDDVNFDSGQIKALGKGGKQRFVYGSATVYKALYKYCHQWRPPAPSDYLFIHDTGQPLTRFYFEHRMQAYCRKAGIIGCSCSPHKLRYTFAVEFLRDGGDVFTLQRILGHSTLEMTRRYAQLADIDVELKLKAFSPVERLNLKV